MKVNVIFISFLLSLLYPTFYLIFQLMVPEGFAFSGIVEGDDGTNLALMASVNHNLENPWMMFEPKNVFLTPNMGSAFLFVPLGYVAKIFGNQFFLIFQLTRFLGAFVFLISVYIFLREFFSEQKSWRIFLLFCFSFGLGGFSFLMQKTLVPDVPFVGLWKPVTYELFEGAGLVPLTILGRHYYTVPLACGLLSIVFLKKSKVFLGGLLLAFAFLFYPSLGVAFYGLSALYLLITRGLNVFRRDIFLYYFLSLVGVVPWIGAYLFDSTMFRFYSTLRFEASPLALFVSTVVHLCFVGYLLIVSIRRKQLFLLLIGLVLLFLLTPVFTGRSLLRYATFSALFIFLILETRKNKKLLFFTVWLIGALFLSILPPQRTILFSARFMLVLWLPLVVVSYLGMEKIVQDIRGVVSVRFLLILVMILTFPSAVFFSTRFLRKPLEPAKWLLPPDYLPVEEYQALQFLKDLPDGVVLSSEEIGTNLPFLTGKESFLGRRPVLSNYEQKLGSYQYFYSKSASEKDRLSLVRKYQIAYIYFGAYEGGISLGDVKAIEGRCFTPVFEKPGVQLFKVTCTE